jgi:cation transport ATPase
MARARWIETRESSDITGFSILVGVVRAFDAAAPMSFSLVSVIANAPRLRRAKL